jgi:hypothetical protein
VFLGENQTRNQPEPGGPGSPGALPKRDFHRARALVFASLTAEGNGD